MKNFTYYRPASAEQVIGLLDARWGTSELLAGGTDLLARQKDYVAQPSKVVSVNGIKDFDTIEPILAGGEPRSLAIGAGASCPASGES